MRGINDLLKHDAEINLSVKANYVGEVFVQNEQKINRNEKEYHAAELFELVRDKLSVGELNQAVEELENAGLVKTRKFPGTEPYSFAYVMPNNFFFLKFRSGLYYDPLKDLQLVLEQILKHNFIDGIKLEKFTNLPVCRVNRAVDLLDALKIVKTYRCQGTDPYTFAFAEAMPVTWDFYDHF